MTNEATPTSVPSRKIVVEFSLMPEGTNRLKAFLDANYPQLLRNNPDTKTSLINIIKEIFPREKEAGQVGSLEEIQRVLGGQSEYAIVIHGLPEREQGNEQALHTYGHYIAEALYAMNNIKQTMSDGAPFYRKNHIQPGETEAGTIHRDYSHRGVERSATKDHYVMLYSSYNGEHAPTQIINLRAALESIPEAQRGNIAPIEVQMSGGTRLIKIDELLQVLLNPQKAPDNDDIMIKTKPENMDPELRDAIQAHSIPVNIQPGSLLIFNERHLFHRALSGDPEMIKMIPQDRKYSRQFFHSSGIVPRSDGPAAR